MPVQKDAIASVLNTDLSEAHEMKQPQDHARRLLVAVTGLTLPVVTETLYALAVKQDPPFVPTEVRLITTAVGAELAKRLLLQRETGQFHRLCADYDLPPITFGPEHVHVLEDADGRPLDDIRSLVDNERAADAIIDVVRDLTSDAECALHVSIAGGRKTMGFYGGYALSLYGREQDRLSHVLVDQPYEGHPDFFYPTPGSVLIQSHGQSYDARDAEVTLAKIPFVRLRDNLAPELRHGTASFSAVVADAQRALPPLALELEPANCMVRAGGESFHMKPAWFATYWMLVERARSGKPGVHVREEGTAKERFDYYRKLVNEFSSEYEKAEEAYFSEGGADSSDASSRMIPADNFNPDKSNINRVLKDCLGKRRAEPYLIKKLGRVGPGSPLHRFGLTLPPAVIRIADGKRAGSGNTGPHNDLGQEKP